MDELHGRQKIIAQLVEARLEQGVSQAELARRVGTQRSNICRLESGVQNPTLEQAVIHYAAGEVRWESGAQIARFRGGHNAITGEQSVIAINSIIGTKGVPSINPFELKPSLTNSKLFARDRNVCAYCGGHFHEEDLTREHIVPFARNGQNHWMNVVTACRPCNHRKGPRTPEQAHMPLLYAPYVPSLWEDFILRNRRILTDQMEFLMAHVPKSSRLLDALDC